MKSGTKVINVRNERSDTSMGTVLSSSSFATTKTVSTLLVTPSKLRTGALANSKIKRPQLLLSKSMERTFRKFRSSPAARDAYVQAEVATFLAHQIRAIRQQRMWTQQDLASKIGTTQAAISRLEDPSYGRLSIKTLLELSRVFDIGLQVRFVSTLTMLANTYQPNAADRLVPGFDEEANDVDFFEESVRTVDIHQIEPTKTVSLVDAPLPKRSLDSIFQLQSTLVTLFPSPVSISERCL